jgi:hypothetical protein
LWPKVPFLFLLWLLLIQKQTHAKVSDQKQQTNAKGSKNEPVHL